MELSISTWMMIFFIIALALSMYKVYAFMPNKVLSDDDTTQEAQDQLTSIMVKTIKSRDKDISVDELYVYMVENDDFDKERYWRFNKNKLNKLLESYYIKNPHAKSIADIYTT
jgi:hypothetical protein